MISTPKPSGKPGQPHMRWFDASPRRATPKGQQSFIFCTAPHPRGPTYMDPPFRARGTPQFPNVSVEQPIFPAIDVIAAHSES